MGVGGEKAGKIMLQPISLSSVSVKITHFSIVRKTLGTRILGGGGTNSGQPDNKRTLVLTEQQELELSPGVPLVTPQLFLDLLVDALLFLGLLGQATRHCSGGTAFVSALLWRPGPPPQRRRRRRTAGCCGAPVIVRCDVHRPCSPPPPPPPPTRPAAVDASCHSTVTTAPCLTKNAAAPCVLLAESTSSAPTTTTTTSPSTGGRPSP